MLILLISTRTDRLRNRSGFASGPYEMNKGLSIPQQGEVQNQVIL